VSEQISLAHPRVEHPPATPDTTWREVLAATAPFALDQWRTSRVVAARAARIGNIRVAGRPDLDQGI